MLAASHVAATAPRQDSRDEGKTEGQPLPTGPRQPIQAPPSFVPGAFELPAHPAEAAQQRGELRCSATLDLRHTLLSSARFHPRALPRLGPASRHPPTAARHPPSMPINLLLASRTRSPFETCVLPSTRLPRDRAQNVPTPSRLLLTPPVTHRVPRSDPRLRDLAFELARRTSGALPSLCIRVAMVTVTAVDINAASARERQGIGSHAQNNPRRADVHMSRVATLPLLSCRVCFRACSRGVHHHPSRLHHGMPRALAACAESPRVPAELGDKPTRPTGRSGALAFTPSPARTQPTRGQAPPPTITAPPP